MPLRSSMKGSTHLACTGHGMWGLHVSHQQGGAPQGRDGTGEQHVLLHLHILSTGAPAVALDHDGLRWQYASHQQG